jgi:hypothetical protein
MTIGDKVRELREGLVDCPKRPDCVSFAGTPLYDLGMAVFPASLGLYDPNRASLSTILLGSDWGNEQSFLDYLERKDRKEHVINQTVNWTDRMLVEAGFDLNDCFYSNAWPFMRAGKTREHYCGALIRRRLNRLFKTNHRYTNRNSGHVLWPSRAPAEFPRLSTHRGTAVGADEACGDLNPAEVFSLR